MVCSLIFHYITPLFSSRGRKIRCDSTRPVCNNCVRRSNVCEYDPFPKRRGPDKRPGTRQRSCKKRPPSDDSEPPPKRKRVSREPPSVVVSTKQESMPESKRSPLSHEHPPAVQASDQVYLVQVCVLAFISYLSYGILARLFSASLPLRTAFRIWLVGRVPSCIPARRPPYLRSFIYFLPG